jgi:hypothetical protein
MSYTYSGFVFHEDGLALALDRDLHPLRVEAKLGTSLPHGFSTCRIEVGELGAVAEVTGTHEEPPGSSRAELLKAKWEVAYTPFRWDRDSRQQPFLGIDIESDGAGIWEAALVSADDALGLTANSGATLLNDLQKGIDRLVPEHILAGHNVRQWDLVILLRHGVQVPPMTEVWDTLEQERELCRDRPRPSYALRTEHHAEQDARRVLELARNQWLRKNAPLEIADEAWTASDQYFVAPTPEWADLSRGLNTAHGSWQDFVLAYRALDPTAVDKAVRGVKWHAVAPPRDGTSASPFNPASPKRIDYWHRLLPAVEAARRGGERSILFVQHQSEIEKLVEVIPGAFSGDARRGVRRLERHGGLLVLHERDWGRTLAEGLPDHTMLILEKMPESVPGVEVHGDGSDQADHDQRGSGENGSSEDDSDQGDTGDAQQPASEETEGPILELPKGRVRQPTPDPQELAKMALWQRRGENPKFVCLDARLRNERGHAPFTLGQVSCEWRAVVPRERVEEAAFRQTTGTFTLRDDWEKDICKWFRVTALHPFQRSKLARILPRESVPYEYVERATGGGKSLIFQGAALYRGDTTGRLTVVISPLRALIHDQVSKLHEKGFALDAEALSGDMSRADIEDAYRRIAGGETKIVYTAPERFRSRGFLQALETRIDLDEGGQPEYWVFDEAHCISLWGLEFRPDYRKAAAYIRSSRERAGANAAPVLLVSATLTRLAKDDIEKVLGFQK